MFVHKHSFVLSMKTFLNIFFCLSMLREDGYGRGDRRDVPNVAMVFTDGNSNDMKKTLQEAYLCKKEGIHVIVVAVSTWIRTNELDAIASYPASSNRFLMDDFDRLSEIVGDMKDLICNSKCKNIYNTLLNDI